jgi:aminoglycoside phosphotransferase (APT) family kinase protein
MRIPRAISITREQKDALASRLGLACIELGEMQPAGMINSVYWLDEHRVLRVPRDNPIHRDQLYREVVAIPAAVAAGVRTADLLFFDDSGEVLASPYAVVQRLRGRNLEKSGIDPRAIPDVWQAIGRDLGRLHAAPLPARLSDAGPDEYDEILSKDPRLVVELRAGEGWFSSFEAQWLLRWLDRLAPYSTHELQRSFVHADVQMSNILLAETSDTYLALLDWGCARCAEPTMDFLSMPLAAVPFLLAGHREICSFPSYDTAEGRILWRRLQLLLSVLPRGAARDCAWGERPVAWILDLMRFFLRPPNERWRAIGPPD